MSNQRQRNPESRSQPQNPQSAESVWNLSQKRTGDHHFFHALNEDLRQAGATPKEIRGAQKLQSFLWHEKQSARLRYDTKLALILANLDDEKSLGLLKSILASENGGYKDKAKIESDYGLQETSRAKWDIIKTNVIKELFLAREGRLKEVLTSPSDKYSLTEKKQYLIYFLILGVLERGSFGSIPPAKILLTQIRKQVSVITGDSETQINTDVMSKVASFISSLSKSDHYPIFTKEPEAIAWDRTAQRPEPISREVLNNAFADLLAQKTISPEYKSFIESHGGPANAMRYENLIQDAANTAITAQTKNSPYLKPVTRLKENKQEIFINFKANNSTESAEWLIKTRDSAIMILKLLSGKLNNVTIVFDQELKEAVCSEIETILLAKEKRSTPVIIIPEDTLKNNLIRIACLESMRDYAIVLNKKNPSIETELVKYITDIDIDATYTKLLNSESIENHLPAEGIDHSAYQLPVDEHGSPHLRNTGVKIRRNSKTGAIIKAGTLNRPDQSFTRKRSKLLITSFSAVEKATALIESEGTSIEKIEEVKQILESYGIDGRVVSAWLNDQEANTPAHKKLLRAFESEYADEATSFGEAVTLLRRTENSSFTEVIKSLFEAREQTTNSSILWSETVAKGTLEYAISQGIITSPRFMSCASAELPQLSTNRPLPKPGILYRLLVTLDKEKKNETLEELISLAEARAARQIRYNGKFFKENGARLFLEQAHALNLEQIINLYRQIKDSNTDPRQAVLTENHISTNGLTEAVNTKQQSINKAVELVEQRKRVGAIFTGDDDKKVMLCKNFMVFKAPNEDILETLASLGVDVLIQYDPGHRIVIRYTKGGLDSFPLRQGMTVTKDAIDIRTGGVAGSNQKPVTVLSIKDVLGATLGVNKLDSILFSNSREAAYIESLIKEEEQAPLKQEVLLLQNELAASGSYDLLEESQSIKEYKQLDGLKLSHKRQLLIKAEAELKKTKSSRPQAEKRYQAAHQAYLETQIKLRELTLLELVKEEWKMTHQRLEQQGVTSNTSEKLKINIKKAGVSITKLLSVSAAALLGDSAIVNRSGIESLSGLVASSIIAAHITALGRAGILSLLERKAVNEHRVIAESAWQVIEGARVLKNEIGAVQLLRYLRAFHLQAEIHGAMSPLEKIDYEDLLQSIARRPEFKIKLKEMREGALHAWTEQEIKLAEALMNHKKATIEKNMQFSLGTGAQFKGENEPVSSHFGNRLRIGSNQRKKIASLMGSILGGLTLEGLLQGFTGQGIISKISNFVPESFDEIKSIVKEVVAKSV